MLLRFTFIVVIVAFFSGSLCGQGCCSGGSGSPIAGGVSQGVLQQNQVEINTNYQFFSSDKFFVGDKDTTPLLHNLNNTYLYSRFAYGVTKAFTMSLEGGYFFNKTETGLNPDNVDNTKKSSGVADLILFPRYNVYNKTDSTTHTEVTLGAGFKIPLGKYNDSSLVFMDPLSGQKFYTTSPPTIQPTNGSHDFIFYGFLFREYKYHKLRVFISSLYVKKGWNPLGQKFGDYASIGIFAGKTIFRKLGVTLQLKGEWVGKMESAPGIDMLAKYNIDLASTGSKRISFVPQLSYSYKSFTIYTLSEIPLYQYLNGTQIGAQYQFTLGASYRFMIIKPFWKRIDKK